MLQRAVEQIEILLEGTNPHAAGALTGAELQSLRLWMQPGETLEAYVRGRITGVGAGWWVVTSSRLLMVDRRQAAGRLEVTPAAVQAIALETGRYGETVTLRVAGERHGLFGVDAALASGFAAALARLAPQATLSTALSSAGQDRADEAALWLLQSRAALLPAAERGVGDMVGLLAQAAALRERGLLNDDEFSALKGRLLQAA